jgi:hypothetical protein
MADAARSRSAALWVFIGLLEVEETGTLEAIFMA